MKKIIYFALLSIGLHACNQFDEIRSSITTCDVDNEIEVTDPKMVNKKELNRVIIDHLMGDSDKSRSSLGYTVSTIKDVFKNVGGLPLGISGQSYYAINWGWGGSCDGYYDLSITNNTIHYPESNFTNMIHDITPKN